MENSAYLFVVYVAFFFGATLFSVLLNSIFLKFSKNLGIRDENNTMIRWSPESKPALGGIVFYIVFLFSIACYSVFFDANTVFHNTQTLGLLACTALAFLMGLADDAYNTRPFLKLGVQILCGVILIATGTEITLFENEWINYVITVFWVVGIMNSINMLDNMDAISSVVSVSILVIALVAVFIADGIATLGFMMPLGVLAALIGFLFFNWHPAKMFMGDTGSQFLGIFLAAIGIHVFWNSADIYENTGGYRQFVLAVLAFLPTLCDTTVVTFNRLAQGKSPLKGGKDHTTHHLSYMGCSDSQVAMIFAGIGIISLVASVFILKFVEVWHHAYTIGFVAYFAVVLAAMFIITRYNRDKR